MSPAAPTSAVRQTLVNLSVSFAAGLLAGIVFWGLSAHSPAPPWLGLCGLVGIVIGEQAMARLIALRRKGSTQGHGV